MRQKRLCFFRFSNEAVASIKVGNAEINSSAYKPNPVLKQELGPTTRGFLESKSNNQQKTEVSRKEPNRAKVHGSPESTLSIPALTILGLWGTVNYFQRQYGV